MCVKNKIVKYVFFGALWFCVSSIYAQKLAFQNTFVDDVFYVKLKPEFRDYFSANTWNKKLGNFIIEPAFKNSPTTSSKANENPNWVDLSLIYTFSTSQKGTSSNSIKNLINIDVFEYIEPKRIHYLAFTPNDSALSQQYYLAQINAYNAWDQTQGNTSIKIGIIDTGTDMDHPDLESEMTQNLADPINGIDDDNDGYIDNFNGWDFMDNDNVPETDESSHGIHVAGIAAAATNNGEGIASVGYNTQFMPIRVANGSAVIYGYEGIVYAADMGCDIINCSWGGFGYSKLEEDVINYATYNKDALVVAAAGNQDKNQLYYPAAYENCLAVASINYLDNKSSFTNHGYWVDISATGEGIFSTWKDGGYNSNTGTSMATPVVAGAASLVKAKYPQLSALQIAERLKSTSTNIDGINSPYENLLGQGRVDVGAAVTGGIDNASVVFGNVKISNKGDDVMKIGDSILISGTFTNYLANSGNVNATISTNSIFVTANNTTVDLGVMGTALQKNNYDNPFSFKILNSAPINEKIDFEVVVTDGSFTNHYFMEVLINVDYLNVTVNNINTTIGSKGQLGYNNRDGLQGLGMTLNNGVSQLFESGIMIGTDQQGFPQVVDRIRNGSSSWDDEFASISNVAQVDPPVKGDYFISGKFSDSQAYVDSIGIEVSYNAYARNAEGHQNYIVLEYTFINPTNTDISSVSAGIFADFDILNYEQNQAHTDWIRFLTYTESTDEPLYFGVQLLSPETFRSYCIDVVSGGNGGIDISTNYTSSNKLTTLSSNRYNAGTSGAGNDVAQVTSASGITIPAFDSVTVAFALHAANNKYVLQNSADSAYKAYNGMLPNSIQDQIQLQTQIKVYPNPAQNTITIEGADAFQGDIEITIFDVTHKKVVQIQNLVSSNSPQLNISNLRSGVYFIEIQTSTNTFKTKFIKM